MTKETSIKLFEEKKVRTVWDEEKEEWYFSVVDVVEVLTDSPRPRKYWNALKTKLKEEGNELSQKLGQLKMMSEDGKYYLTDVADVEQLFRLIQSIPSPKAEPFKQWMAHVASFDEHAKVAIQGGEIARNARQELELKTDKAVISPLNAKTGMAIGKSNNKELKE
jgi:hypothetical protein